MWHFALTKAQSRCDSKCAIHMTHNLTREMPYSSMLYCVNLNSLAFREKIFLVIFSMTFLIQPPVSTAFSLHPDPRILSQGLDLLKPF